MKTTSIPFVWSNDDIAPGKLTELERLLDFLDRQELPGVFFVIPKTREGRSLDDDVSLCRTIEDARTRGHEFYQHGYIHTPFESGVPATWMLDFSPEVRERYDTERLEIEASHTLERMVEKIAAGQRIWRRALGEDSPGYRPGWGAFCGNMYRALEVLGFAWSSSRCCTKVSWLWSQKHWEVPADLPVSPPGTPWREGRVMEYPIGGDYGFYIDNDPEDIRRMVGLFQTEFDAFHQRGWPFLPVSHWHGLAHDGGTGYEIHGQALAAIRETGKADFIGFSELHHRTTAALPPAEEDQTLCL